MKVQELRIGNWINLKGVPTQIESIHNESGVNVWTETDRDMSVIEGEHEIGPIPLTTDLLKQLGFQTSGNGFYGRSGWDFHVDYFRITIYKNGKVRIKTPCNNGESRRLRHIIFLHQLQNLYYALTNQELKINL